MKSAHPEVGVEYCSRSRATAGAARVAGIEAELEKGKDGQGTRDEVGNSGT
jgi:hypothetical protein